MAMAHVLSSRSQRLELIKEQPQLAREFADLFGKEYLDQVKRHDRAEVTSEVEALLEQAVEGFGDVQVKRSKSKRDRQYR